MAKLFDLLQKLEEYLAPLFEFAKGFRGFTALAAFLVIAALMMFSLVFSQGSFDPVLENFQRLTPEQFHSVIMLTILLVGGLGILLINRASHDIMLNSADGYAFSAIVHEEGDPTLPVSGATVTLTLNEAISQRTNERGGVVFTFERRWSGRTCQINARHDDYEIREPLSIDLQPTERVLIALKKKPTAVEAREPASEPPPDRVYISYSPGNERAAHAVAALLNQRRFYVWPVERPVFTVGELTLGTEQTIRRSDFVVGLFSQQDAILPTVANETGFALDVKKPVIPVRLEAGVALPDRLRDAGEPVDIYANWGLEGETLLNRLQMLQQAPQSHDTFEPEVRKPAPNTNPFVYGGAVRDDLFIGRHDVLNAIVGRLGLELQSVSIVANRRMGKTSLLNYVRRRYKALLPSEYTWIVVYMDMMDARTHDAAGVMRLLRRGIAQQVKRDLWPERFDGDIRMMAEKFEELADSGVRLVLCLDEWESVMAYPEMDAFIEQLRSSGSMFNLGMIVATAHELTELARQGDFSSPFYNIFEAAYLGAMPEAEWHLLVQRAYQRSSREVSARDLELIGALAGGHPYLTQLAGALVWDSHEKNWTRRDVLKLYNRKSQKIFDGLWIRQSELQKAAVRQVLGISAGEAVPEAVWEDLRLRGVLTRQNELFCLPFADYVMSREL